MKMIDDERRCPDVLTWGSFGEAVFYRCTRPAGHRGDCRAFLPARDQMQAMGLRPNRVLCARPFELTPRDLLSRRLRRRGA